MRVSARSGWRVAIFTALLWAVPGCVKVYQPVSGLQRPVVVDPRVANFEDIDLTVYCPPGDLVNPHEAQVLCRKVATLFENQGARVTTFTEDRRVSDELLVDDLAVSDADAVPDAEAAAVAPPTDLVLELRGRQIHESKNPMTWLLFVGTFSLVPGVAEFTFAQDVVIRDGDGFLLVSDTLEGRIIRYVGLGAWAGNKLQDLLSRPPEDRLVGDTPHRTFSADYYGQLSQLLFNAKLRWQVLQEATPEQE